jgi:hypothetical protein
MEREGKQEREETGGLLIFRKWVQALYTAAIWGRMPAIVPKVDEKGRGEEEKYSFERGLMRSAGECLFNGAREIVRQRRDLERSDNSISRESRDSLENDPFNETERVEWGVGISLDGVETLVSSK